MKRKEKVLGTTKFEENERKRNLRKEKEIKKEKKIEKQRHHHLNVGTLLILISVFFFLCSFKFRRFWPNRITKNWKPVMRSYVYV